ncbi:hypothetical protein Tco_0700590 [Tanacetum coccineum]
MKLHVVSYGIDSFARPHKANQDNLPKKPELNDDMYNWVIAKYGKPNTWTDSQFESIADDVYTTFFEKAEPEKVAPEKAEPKKPKPAKTRNVEAQQGADIAKITRKRLKPGKHEHGNGRARKKPGGSYQSQKVKHQSTLG